MQEQYNLNQETTAPLHAVLWSIGKNLMGFSKTELEATKRNSQSSYDFDSKVQALTVQQLATSLRMHGIEGEDEVLLSSLESMVLAGEISFRDFIGRLQNLFPKTLDALDVTLRMKVAARLIQQD